MTKPQVCLFIDGENVGTLTSVESKVEEQELSIMGHPMILSKPSMSPRYILKMPGMELEVRKFLQTSVAKENIYNVFLDSDDILIAQLFPHENKQLFVKVFDKVEAAKIPYTVYNENMEFVESMKKLDSNGQTGNLTLIESDDDDEQEKLIELIPALKDCKEKCPACDNDKDHEGTLWDIIIYLNDTHEWSRERIADWLETLDADITFPIGE